MNAPDSDRPDSPHPEGTEGVIAESRVDAVVRQAEALPENERLSFLQQTCSGDNLLLAQALDKLRFSAPQWWDDSIESRAFARGDSLHERTGEMIGPYRILRSLGVGGMGEVLLAERDDRQFRQQVAIKLVRRGIQSTTVQARLKSERQILASLDHPNIARLLDGGTAADGTPYIVMEYIEGVPIDAYCDRHQLDIDARLRLFRAVCAAVHNAHQNLVVHRDLKPSNILVMADGTPKLLDFGIAKLLDERLTMHTMAVTQVDMRVMTPDHASPEQVRGDVITTASDVYCLGVLLFELVSGARPYVIRSQRISEIERVICEDEPRALLAAAESADEPDSSSSNALAEKCALRSTTPTKLRRLLTGDLSIIVATAMRKEPERRYSSVEQLSADIGRFLDDMPIAARPDSWQYRAQKFVRRHRFGVASAAIAAFAFIAFTTVTVVQSQRIAREKARAETISTFLVDMFEQADPTHNRGREITAREILDIGSRRIARQLDDQVGTRAELQGTIGKVYSQLGLYDEAEALLRTALTQQVALYGDQSGIVAATKQKLGDMLLEKKDFEAAAPLLEDALVVNRRVFGVRHTAVAASLRSLARLKQQQQDLAQAEAYLSDALAILENTNESGELAMTLDSQAQLFTQKGDYAGAEKNYRRALASAAKLGSDHPYVAMMTHNLAVTLQNEGRLEEARPLFQESLKLYGQLFGAEHPHTLAMQANYGMFLHRLRDLDGAERVYRDVLELDRKVRGESHSYTGYDHVNLGMLLHDRGKYSEAETEFRSALDIYERSLPANHSYQGAARRALGITLIESGRPQEAERELQTALRIFNASVTDTNPQVLATQAALGYALAKQRRFVQAESLLRDNYAALYKALSSSHPVVLRTRAWIESLYDDFGKPGEAQAFLSDVTAQNATPP